MSAQLQFLPLESTPLSSPRASPDASDDDDVSIGHYDHIVPAKDVAWKKTNLVTLPNTPDSKISAAVAAAVVKKPAMTREQKVKLFTRVMTFLPLEDIENARLASPEFGEAANMVAPKPLGNDELVFVRWEPQEVRTAMQPAHLKTLPPTVAAHRHHNNRNGGQQAPVTSLAPAIFPWRCLACGTVTSGPRQCGTCRATLATSACRVFLGQLRKELSAELMMAMVRSLLPDVNVLHMESHTNTDGRGKGCAWAYVDSVEDAMRVVELHKRVFIDLDAEGGEGFWFVKNPALVSRLGEMAEILGAARARPSWLPRQPLVAELPGKSMLGEYVASLLH